MNDVKENYVLLKVFQVIERQFSIIIAYIGFTNTSLWNVYVT